MYIHLERSRGAPDNLGFTFHMAAVNLSTYVARLFKDFLSNHRNQHVQAELAASSDYMLADVGLTRADLPVTWSSVVADPAGAAWPPVSAMTRAQRHPMIYGLLVFAVLTFATSAANAGEGNGDPFPFRAPSLVFPDRARQPADMGVRQSLEPFGRVASAAGGSHLVAQQADRQGSERN